MARRLSKQERAIHAARVRAQNSANYLAELLRNALVSAERLQRARASAVHDTDALAALLEGAAPPSAPAPVEVERCTGCNAPAHPSETDDAGECERCRTGEPHRAPENCEIHGCLFEACDCPACEHCAGFGCQVCGWSGRLLCEHCGRPRVGDRDECGSIGDGICADRAAEIDALLHPAAEEVLAACFFCHQPWGSCTCRWSDEEGFEHEGSCITRPNVSICGRFYINPETYYGDSYKSWAAKR